MFDLYEAVAEPDSAPLVTLDYDEVVGSGLYRLVVKADGDVGMDSTFDFSMAADPGPPRVPGLGPIGALGLVLSIGVLVRRASGSDPGRA